MLFLRMGAGSYWNEQEDVNGPKWRVWFLPLWPTSYLACNLCVATKRQ
jgi:hypothetical protein